MIQTENLLKSTLTYVYNIIQANYEPSLVCKNTVLPTPNENF